MRLPAGVYLSFMGRAPELELYHPAKSVAAALRKKPDAEILERGPHDYPGSHSGISLNGATVEELERAEFIDAAAAKRIVEARTARDGGGFRSWSELREVPGLSVTMIADLQRSFRIDVPAE